MQTSKTLDDRGLGGAGLTSVGCCAEVDACGAVFGVVLELVLDVCGGAVLGATLEYFDCAAAVHAAELGIVVFERDVDGFDLPEWLVTAGGADAAALHFTLVEFFPFDCHETPR